MRLGRILTTMFLGGLVLAAPLAARAADEPVLIPTAEMQSRGVEPTNCQPAVMSPDGRMLLGLGVGKPEDVKRGAPRTLWLLNLRSDGHLGDVRRFDLKVPTLEQVAFTPDMTKAVVISRSGATYLLVDLATGAVTTLMDHQKGQKGFRADPTVLWLTKDGRLLTTGYFYDENDYAGENVIAEIDPSKTGVAAFQAGPNVEQLERKYKGLEFTNYNTESLGFLGGKDGKLYKMHRWQPDTGLVLVDESEQFTSMWGAGDRLLYSALRRGGLSELVLYDAPTNTRKVLSDDRKEYSYLFLSSDASTAVASLVDQQAGKISLFAAREADGFQLRPIEGMQRVPIGMVRVSGDGERVVLLNKDGLQVVDL